MTQPTRIITIEGQILPGPARPKRWWFLLGILIGIWLAAAVLLVPRWAAAKDTIDGPLRAQVVSVYDGDTFTAKVRIWFETEVTTSVRVLGIDTPEIRGKCDAEKALAIAAREALVRLLAGGSVILRDLSEDKYGGRIDARVIAAGVDVAQRMVELGHARPYDGGKREGWCG